MKKGTRDSFSVDENNLKLKKLKIKKQIFNIILTYYTEEA